MMDEQFHFEAMQRIADHEFQTILDLIDRSMSIDQKEERKENNNVENKNTD